MTDLELLELAPVIDEFQMRTDVITLEAEDNDVTEDIQLMEHRQKFAEQIVRARAHVAKAYIGALGRATGPSARKPREDDIQHPPNATRMDEDEEIVTPSAFRRAAWNSQR